MVSTGGSDRDRGDKPALGLGATQTDADQPGKDGKGRQAAGNRKYAPKQHQVDVDGPDKALQKPELEWHDGSPANHPSQRDPSKPIEIAGFVASLIAAIAAIAGVAISHGQLKEMKAQRTQDAIDGAQSDLRQDKLIIVAGQQASSTAALARSSADQLVSIKASADAAIAQAHAASAASGATGRLAQSSSDQVKVLLDADRAWISAATVPNSFDFVVGQDFVAHTQISNTGKSPAIKVRSFTKWEIMERTSPYEALKECETCASEAVFPGTMRTIEPKILGSALTQSEVEGLKSGVKIFVVRVRVDYSDVSGRRHTTTMCSFYNLPTKGFTACAVGSEAT